MGSFHILFRYTLFEYYFNHDIRWGRRLPTNLGAYIGGDSSSDLTPSAVRFCNSTSSLIELRPSVNLDISKLCNLCRAEENLKSDESQ